MLNKCLGFLLLLSLGIGSAPTLELIHGASFRIVDVLFIIYILGLAIWLCMGYRLVNTASIYTAPIFIHLCLLVVMPLLGYIVYTYEVNNITSSFRFLLILVSLVAFWILFMERNNNSYRVFVWALIIGIICNFVLSTLQQAEFFGLISGDYLPHYQYEHLVDNPKFYVHARPVGFFSDPNQLGWYGVLVSMISLGIVMDGRELRKVGFFGFIFSVLVIAISTSRSAIISFFVGCIVIGAALSVTKGRSGGKLIGVFVIIALSIVWFAFNTEMGRYIARGLSAIVELNLAADTSFAARSEGSWIAAIDAFKEYPLGFFGDPTSVSGTIDSNWLSYLVQGSFILVSSYLVVLMSAVWRSFQLLKDEAFNGRIAVSVACLGMSVALAVGSVVLSPFHQLHILVPYIILYMLVARR